ncbi:E3 ubiquitin-protein ligase RNF213-like [Anneissia japonica]|uniref:E3 ubiquitin-protein ligase RNF213-like n=1 Tax=Anneissia japonica TaxID=1529436 RepID=UPI0014257E6C|nr:E3 ubiquitin-protein ligase RNF213-like [Anneissia japonica]
MDVERITKSYLQGSQENVDVGNLVKRVIKQRETELDAFSYATLCVGVMVTMCREIFYDSNGKKSPAVDTKQIEDDLEMRKEKLQLKDLCNPAEVHMIMISICTPEITFYKFSDDVSAMLHEIQRIHLSVIFQHFWKRRVKRVVQQRAESNNLMTLDDVEKQIWQQVKEEWQEFGVKLITGLITLNSITNNLQIVNDNALEDSLKIFRIGNSPDKWIKERSDQIRLYRQLSRCLVTAETIQEIQTTFELQGDFSSIELLCSTSKRDFKNKCLIDLNTDVAKACRELENVTREETKSLKTLMKCKKLILWIKREIKNMQELKVFVDLAMIQAGENDIEISRVSCLYQAATGYAAFIFDLNEEFGYTDLMTICKHTWITLKNDPMLSEKLEDTSRHMEWLKHIKDSYGSAEVASLHQVKRINAGEIYEIGKLKESEVKSSKDTSFESLPTVLCRSQEETYKKEVEKSQQLLPDMSLSKALQFMDKKDLECAICLSRFQQPKTLKCMHTYCLQCIQKWVETHGKMKCPTCGQNHNLTKEDLKKLASNEMISHILEYVKKTEDQTPTKCSVCENQPAYHCSTCQLFLCRDQCIKHHKTIPSTKDHPLYKLDIKEQDGQPTNCQVHCNTTLEFYCSNCNKSACKKCEHILRCYQKQHKVIPISTAVDKFNKDANEIVELAHKIEKTLTEKLEMLTKVRSEFDSQLKLCRTAIEIQEKKLIRNVQEKTKELISDLESMYKNKENDDSEINDIDLKINQVKNLIVSINSIMNKPEETETLLTHKATIKAVEDKVLGNDFEQSFQKRNITPNFIPSMQMDQLMNTEGIGKITAVDQGCKNDAKSAENDVQVCQFEESLAEVEYQAKVASHWI